jgi:hypothetical protein
MSKGVGGWEEFVLIYWPWVRGMDRGIVLLSFFDIFGSQIGGNNQRMDRGGLGGIGAVDS